jgi:type I restriction enzyme S subunit
MLSTNLNPYESYKDTGIDWLGAIPTDWNLKPGLAAFSENKRTNQGMKEKQVLSLSYGSIVIKPEEKMTGLMPESFETYQIVEPGDIIIRGTDLQNDKTSLRTGLVNDHGIITSAYLCLKVAQNCNPRYMHYLLYSLDTSKALYKFGSGLRQNLSYEDFKRLPVIDIPDGQQIAIADFLDDKTAKIEHAIDIKQEQIALLREIKQIIIQQAVTTGLNPDAPMKDSGVEWIGKIPAHWTVISNRRIFREKSRYIRNLDEMPLSLSQVDGVIPSNEMKERSLAPSHRNNFKLCLPGDLVLNRFKGHLGVLFESNYRGIITFHYGVFEPNKSILTKYFEYLYHTQPYKMIYAGASNGMTIGLQNLSNQNFYSVKSIVPPRCEQADIVKHIAILESKFRDAISAKEEQIAALKEYKSTLISSAVTGKIKVV